MGLDDVEVAQHVTDGPVAVARGLLGAEDPLVDPQGSAGEFGEEIEQQALGVPRVGLGKLGNGVGRRAVVERLVTPMEFLQQPLDHVGCCGC